MESLANWNAIEWAIHEALEEHAEDLRQGACGLSPERTIYNKLLSLGFLREINPDHVY